MLGLYEDTRVTQKYDSYDRFLRQVFDFCTSMLLHRKFNLNIQSGAQISITLQFLWCMMVYCLSSLLFCCFPTRLKQEGHDPSPQSFSPKMNSTSLFLWFQLVTLGMGPVLIRRGIIRIKLTKVYKEMLHTNKRAMMALYRSTG